MKNLKKTQVAYAGDDLNDLILKNNVSLFISPANADKTIRKKSNILLKNKYDLLIILNLNNTSSNNCAIIKPIIINIKKNSC